MGQPLPPLHDLNNRKNVTIEIPPATIANDEAFVRELVGIINTEYSWGEAGVVRDGTKRTTVSEVADQLRARHFAVAFLPSSGGTREIVGCISAKRLNATHGVMSLLVVRSEHHGTGVARDLFRFGEEHCRRTFGAKFMQIELLVPTTVESAHKVRLQAWYEKMGYAVVSMGDFAADYPHMVPLLLGPTDYRVFEKSLDAQARTSRRRHTPEAKL